METVMVDNDTPEVRAARFEALFGAYKPAEKVAKLFGGHRVTYFKWVRGGIPGTVDATLKILEQIPRSQWPAIVTEAIDEYEPSADDTK